MMPLLDTVTPENARGKVREVYGIFETMRIPVPLSLQMMSVSPDYLAIQGQTINYFMNHPSLSPLLLAHIRLLAAHEENYTYCINLNQQILKSRMGLSDEQISAVTDDPDKTVLNPEEKALLAFVRKAVRDPATTSAEDVENLRTLGWSDRDIFDATLMGMHMLDMGMMFKAFQMGS